MVTMCGVMMSRCVRVRDGSICDNASGTRPPRPLALPLSSFPPGWNRVGLIVTDRLGTRRLLMATEKVCVCVCIYVCVYIYDYLIP